MRRDPATLVDRPLAPAVFLGWQDGFGVVPSFRIYNLTADVAGHPKHSTVSEHTLSDLGYALPQGGAVAS